MSITVDYGHWIVQEIQEDDKDADFWLLVDLFAFRTGYSELVNILDARWDRREFFEMTRDRIPESSPLDRIFGTNTSVAPKILMDPIWFVNGVREAVDHPTTGSLMFPEGCPS